ncbi:hypothetical protein [Aeromonas jandaei]|uniref:hypothetical protein n=1 Tax=Aeromonas jandaei TaxID=650 RepID=UPI003D1A9C02
MKTHELANFLENLAQFLKALPNYELGSNISADKQSENLSTQESVDETQDNPEQSTKDLDEKLKNLTLDDIDYFLNSYHHVLTTQQLTKIAEHFGISISTRQNKRALINQITRTLESHNVHSIIKSSRTEE